MTNRRHAPTDAHRATLQPLLPGNDRGLVIDGILQILHTGAAGATSPSVSAPEVPPSR